MEPEPDFKALAEAWVEGDPRTEELDGERRAQLVLRMAHALEKRWSRQSEEEEKIGLVVNVQRDLLSPENPETLDQLTEYVQERIDQDRDD